uniref:Uncharacterized protein n=1 Tax=Panagrolaimus sp. ES5 TaxID=591445 RepID=A0AC34G060_9BILA
MQFKASQRLLNPNFNIEKFNRVSKTVKQTMTTKEIEEHKMVLKERKRERDRIRLAVKREAQNREPERFSKYMKLEWSDNQREKFEGALCNSMKEAHRIASSRYNREKSLLTDQLLDDIFSPSGKYSYVDEKGAVRAGFTRLNHKEDFIDSYWGVHEMMAKELAATQHNFISACREHLERMSAFDRRSYRRTIRKDAHLLAEGKSPWSYQRPKHFYKNGERRFINYRWQPSIDDLKKREEERLVVAERAKSDGIPHLQAFFRIHNEKVKRLQKENFEGGETITQISTEPNPQSEESQSQQLTGDLSAEEGEPCNEHEAEGSLFDFLNDDGAQEDHYYFNF